MPFDINDSRLINFFRETNDEISVEEVEDVERDRRNYLNFDGKSSKFTYIGVSIGGKGFDKEQLEKTIDTEISQLG